MEWSPQQDAALVAVRRWLQESDRQVFRLFGYAGTGKTTLARHFAEGVKGTVLFAAFTGKAALCLYRAGCPRASTIHSLIYHPRDKSRKKLVEIRAELTELEAEGRGESPEAINLRRAIRAEELKLRAPAFELNPDSELADAELLIVDEVSMVDERMAKDILSFGTKVLVLGDPFQLPPVKGCGYFTQSSPDVMLEEIHRQADGDPIIHLATFIRERGRAPDVGRYGESRVIPRDAWDPEDVDPRAQIIVGRNKSRRRGNARRRRALGFGDWQPAPGDRLVCLRNDHALGLLNGAIWNVTALSPNDDGYLGLWIEDDDGLQGMLDVQAHPQPFQGEDVPFWTRKQAQEFDFGYVLTCHKSQGSQWDDVLVVDESGCFRNQAANWLYTAVTRAAKRMTLVRWQA